MTRAPPIQARPDAERAACPRASTPPLQLDRGIRGRQRAGSPAARAGPERRASCPEPAREPLAAAPRAGRGATGGGFPRRPRRRGPRAYGRGDRAPRRREVLASLAACCGVAPARSLGGGAGGGPDLAPLRRGAARRPRPDRGGSVRPPGVPPLDR